MTVGSCGGTPIIVPQVVQCHSHVVVVSQFQEGLMLVAVRQIQGGQIIRYMCLIHGKLDRITPIPLLILMLTGAVLLHLLLIEPMLDLELIKIIVNQTLQARMAIVIQQLVFLLLQTALNTLTTIVGCMVLQKVPEQETA
jgi:hypothetical protein